MKGVVEGLRGCELNSRVSLVDGSRGCELIEGDVTKRCIYPRLDCVGEEGRRARVGGEG
jgi:hypothetical protein